MSAIAVAAIVLIACFVSGTIGFDMCRNMMRKRALDDARVYANVLDNYAAALKSARVQVLNDASRLVEVATSWEMLRKDELIQKLRSVKASTLGPVPERKEN